MAKKRGATKASKQKRSTAIREFDVCIVGAGPAGLAALSAIQEPYSLDGLTEGQIYRAARHVPSCTGRSVAVIDPHPQWMEGWSNNFKALDIQFLRSPTMAHPDLFDKNALIAFAERHGRQNELVESGCGDLYSLIPLGESQVGLWKLPSVSLFEDFCADMAKRLKHNYIRGKVDDISNETDGGPLLEVSLDDGSKIRAASVVLAMGVVGKQIVPQALVNSPNIVPWTILGSDTDFMKECKRVLVVGGGLTAVQAAQRVYRQNKNAQVTLVSRRPLVERHFDLSLDWFDRRTSTKMQATFYHESKIDRLALLKESRGGGSVPGIYMKDLLEMEESGRLIRKVGNAANVDVSSPHDDTNGNNQSALIKFDDGQLDSFDAIVMACGLQPDCETHPLCKKLLDRWPLEVVGGFPAVSEDLEWTKNLYVLGGLGSLNIGPDAANLNGMRRAAQIIGNAMGCRCWLHEAEVLKNPFHAFMDDTSDSEDEDEE